MPLPSHMAWPQCDAFRVYRLCCKQCLFSNSLLGGCDLLHVIIIALVCIFIRTTVVITISIGSTIISLLIVIVSITVIMGQFDCTGKDGDLHRCLPAQLLGDPRVSAARLPGRSSGKRPGCSCCRIDWPCPFGVALSNEPYILGPLLFGNFQTS